MSELVVETLALGPIGTNCYIVGAAGRDDAIVIDPGADPDRVFDALARLGRTAAGVLVTHCHWDHIGAVAAVARTCCVPTWMSSLERVALEDPDSLAIPGLPPVEAWLVDHPIDGGDVVELVGLRIEVLAAPGHSPGHLVFLVEADEHPHLFVGDVVFRGSVGRTDLPFADGAELGRTLASLAARLAPATVLWPGHGGATTWARELAGNPFLQAVR